MKKQYSLIDQLKPEYDLFLPSISVDCVIFGFHENQLKVLLLKPEHNKKWALPGGFVFKDEDVEDAATRILQHRTQLKDMFLKQFYLFGSAKRTRQKHAKELLKKTGIPDVENHWILQRFVSVGYYALAEYSKVDPRHDEISTECSWKDLKGLPDLIIDHKNIIEKALETLRQHLNYEPIGYNLLSDAFTMKDIQSIYETILGKKLDRRNFQRKILSYGILDKKEKHFSGGAHKAPYLYSFNKTKYFEALENGLEKGW
jgi:8-oxo-dGTP diphosphatase